MGLGIPPIQIKIMLESNPLKSTMLVGGLGVTTADSNHLQELWLPARRIVNTANLHAKNLLTTAI